MLFVLFELFALAVASVSSDPILGIGNFKLMRLAMCDPSYDYPIKYEFNFKKGDGGIQYMSGKGHLKVDFGDHADHNVTIGIKRTKDEADFSPMMVLYEPDACEGIKKYLGQFLFDLQKASGIEPGTCPIPKMMKHAWDNYVRYAWGKNELKPVTKRGHGASIFGSMPMGATILDGLDTLYIMGMNEEFKQGRDWIANELNLEAMTSDVSVFEVNIRFVGGLLACYALTGDAIFKHKAQAIADKLLPAFETPTGIPHALVNFRTGSSKNYGWASGGSSILSEFGTLHLEFAYLSDVTGKSEYRNKVDHIRQFLLQKEKPKGLYPNYLNPKTGNWGQHHMSMGALGDSFYEYLLKAWIQSNKEDNEARQMYDDAMAAIIQHMLFTSKNGLSYFAELKFDRPEHKMDHLGCFSGGLVGLGAQTLRNEVSDKYMDVAKRITETCHESYDRSTTKLGPESFRFTDGIEAKALKSSEKYYILRPEVVESYFYMYRLTKDQKYRDWGWEMVQALEKHCRVDGGYTGIKNVYADDPLQDDVQQSFFLAETLKYLYLLFSDESLLPLDEWVLNTEAHPLPIKGVNPFYREATV